MADYLYKYRSLEGAERLYAERLLVHNEVYFASPSAFNDPFDSQVHISMSGTNEEYRKKLLGIYRRKEPKLSEEVRRCKVEHIVAEGGHRRPDVSDGLAETFRTKAEKLGVFCLAGYSDSVLMWSHYCVGHTGFCVQYLHQDQDEPFLGRAKMIEYSNSYPEVVFVGDPDEGMVEKSLLTKAEWWRYEGEWRIIELRGPGTYTVPPELLSGVIFGCRMGKANRAQVREWCLQRKPRPQLYEARPTVNQFGLDIVPVE